MKKTLTILFLFIALLVHAEGGVFQGFSGGMMVHMGYQYGSTAAFREADGSMPCLRSATLGIGGALKINLFSHWKIGAEGYVSTMPLRSYGEGSSVRAAWGGVLNEFYLNLGKTQAFVGATLGGGAQKSTHVYSDGSQTLFPFDKNTTLEDIRNMGNQEETYPAEFTKYGMFVFDPYIGIEVPVTSRIHIIVKADWLVAAHRNQFLYPTGPRLYLGFMFAH